MTSQCLSCFMATELDVCVEVSRPDAAVSEDKPDPQTETPGKNQQDPQLSLYSPELPGLPGLPE